VEFGVERPLISFCEKIQFPPEHLEMLRLLVFHKVLLGIPFFKKKESIFILGTLAEFTVLASLFNPYGFGQCVKRL
jgi:hypothetical protein